MTTGTRKAASPPGIIIPLETETGLSTAVPMPTTDGEWLSFRRLCQELVSIVPSGAVVGNVSTLMGTESGTEGRGGIASAGDNAQGQTGEDAPPVSETLMAATKTGSLKQAAGDGGTKAASNTRGGRGRTKTDQPAAAVT